MAITATLYGQYPKTLANKESDWDTNAIKLALVTSSYTPDQDAHQYWSSVVANDMAASGDYTANGVALAGLTSGYTAGTNVTKLSANNLTIGNTGAVTGAFRYGVIYDSTPATDATRPLVAWVDFGAQTVANAIITITWNAAGIVTFTVS
jgi:hypothetical protein